uniref:Putative structural protein n=1 Tax=viral metagenome TaxID=1070528 RepID=A0A6H2A2K2_9ZZZZ
MKKAMEKLIQTLKQDEGYRDKIYKDTEGNLTCGWGHKLAEGGPVPEAAAEAFFKMDIAYVVSSMLRIPREYKSKLNEARARVIACMVYNMGYRRAWSFKKMWAAIYLSDWKLAKAEMFASKWAFQIGDGPGGKDDRVERLAEIMLTGVWPKEENQ